MDRSKGTILLAETIGTFVLVLGGCGTAVIAGKYVGGTLGVAMAFGLTLLCMAYAIGGITGCHINPAVTVGLLVAGKCAPDEAPFYIVGQIIGGIIAGGVLYAIALSQAGATRAKIVAGGFASNGYGAHSPHGYKLAGAIIVEVVLTAMFLFIITSTFHRSFPAGFGGIAVGPEPDPHPPHLHPGGQHLGQPGPQPGRGRLRGRLGAQPALGVHRLPPDRWRAGRAAVAADGPRGSRAGGRGLNAAGPGAHRAPRQMPGATRRSTRSEPTARISANAPLARARV